MFSRRPDNHSAQTSEFRYNHFDPQSPEEEPTYVSHHKGMWRRMILTITLFPFIFTICNLLVAGGILWLLGQFNEDELMSSIFFLLPTVSLLSIIFMLMMEHKIRTNIRRKSLTKSAAFWGGLVGCVAILLLNDKLSMIYGTTSLRIFELLFITIMGALTGIMMLDMLHSKKKIKASLKNASARL